MASRRTNNCGAASFKAVLDRRQFFVSAGALLAMPVIKVSAAENSVSELSRALLELSNQGPYDDFVIASFSDGSQIFKDAEAAVKNVGGQVVNINPKGDTAAIQDKYRESNCYAAIVPDLAVLTKAMKGIGLECSNCGFPSGPTGPKWIIVLGKTTKTGEQIQEEAGMTGRECNPDGTMCFQFGKGTPVYTLPELLAFKYSVAAAGPAAAHGPASFCV